MFLIGKPKKTQGKPMFLIGKSWNPMENLWNQLNPKVNQWNLIKFNKI